MFDIVCLCVTDRESKLTQLMRDSLGNLSCRTCMIAHVSPTMAAYNETLHVIQLAAKIHRMKRRRTKVSKCHNVIVPQMVIHTIHLS